MKRLLLATCVATLPLAFGPVMAQENSDRLQVGADVADFTLKDQQNNDVNLKKLLADKPVALVFYRSADW